MSAILNKLYKNPNKIEKLQSIMSKHVKATEYGTRKNYVIDWLNPLLNSPHSTVESNRETQRKTLLSEPSIKAGQVQGK